LKPRRMRVALEVCGLVRAYEQAVAERAANRMKAEKRAE
jgi:hypothetical protein